MFNASALIKFMGYKNKFEENHPKFASFCASFMNGDNKIEEGTVIEITVSNPGEKTVAANIKLKASDIQMLNEIKNLK